MTVAESWLRTVVSGVMLTVSRTIRFQTRGRLGWADQGDRPDRVMFMAVKADRAAILDAGLRSEVMSRWLSVEPSGRVYEAPCRSGAKLRGTCCSALCPGPGLLW
jgi:hypothetical protein